MKVKVFITGATGYLGAGIVRALLASGEHSVIALIRNPEKFQQLRSWCSERTAQLQSVTGDIRTLQRLPEGTDTIIHAAAQRGFRECEKRRAETIQVNVRGTCNLLRLAARHQAQRFVYISSQSVYGEQQPPWSEEMETDPQGVYAVTKYAGEQLVWAFENLFDLAILRPARIYGVSLFMRWSEIIGEFVQMAYRGQPISVHGDGTQRFDLVHIRDTVECVLQLLDIYPDGWNDTYNVGSGRSVSLNELVAFLAQGAMELGLPTVIVEQHPEIIPRGLAHLELDITYTRRKLGWKPRCSLQEELKEYLTTYAQSQ